ncbi:MAG: SLOG family protein [Oscillospiraceae bacterium]
MIKSERTICFSGHRREKMPKGKALEVLEERLVGEIEKAIGDGYDTFLFGGCYGFDLTAAAMVLSRKRRIDFLNPRRIRLIAIIPFENQALHWRESDRALYYDIMPQCDDVITLSLRYHDKCYADRNQYMTERSSRLICYWDGELRSGTAQTIRMAQNQGMEIINLY